VKTTKRLFLALVLPDEIKQKLNNWRALHLETIELPPVPVENYHVTLAYIGTVNADREKMLIERLGEIKADSFPLLINKTDYWPTPKVLHLIPTMTPPRLLDLQRKVNKAIEHIGLPIETRPYRPHLTLYRKISQERFEQLEEDGLPEPHVDIAVEQFAIYESISDRDGVHYEKMDAFDLIGAFA
jgi:2'-5' RNA ligase